MFQYLPFILIAAVFYFMIYMPMQKQKKRQQQMLSDLKNGDQVVTNSGIRGIVSAVNDETIVLKVRPDNVKLEFARSAVNALVPPEGSK